MKYLKLLRVKHWIKNLIIILPFVFSAKLSWLDMLKECGVGIILYSILSSVIYIFNDINDVEGDKKHPIKCNRPIASGCISIKQGWLIMGIMLFLLLGWVLYRKNSADWILFLYFCCNIGYSLGAKNFPLVDISILAGGYILRVMYGGAITGIEISDWMYLTILCGSCYLGFAKRRNEMRTVGDSGRKMLVKYTYGFLDKSTQLFMGLAMVFYSLWCVDGQTVIAERGSNFIWSVPVIYLILLKYNLQLEKEGCDGDPVEVILQDKWILGMVAVYIIITLKALYL